MYDFLDMGLRYEELNEYQKNKADWIQKVERYSENTKRTYWLILNSRVNQIEIHKNKDLYDWSKEEIIQLIKNTPTKSRNTKVVLYSIIVRYMEWVYKKGIKSGDNPCNTIDPKELFTISELAIRESYQTIQEFYDFILGLNCSDVDRAMLTLLRYGVKIDYVGKVKWEDIDRENKILNVYQEDNLLQLPIDNLFIMMMNQARACDRYAPGQKMVEYVDYGYIIKATPTVAWEAIPAENVYNKIGQISRANQITRISVPELNLNRKYDMLFNILNQCGKVEKSDIERVIVIFGEEITAIKVMKLRQIFELISGIEVQWKRKNRTN